MNHLELVTAGSTPDERIAHDPYDLKSIAERMLANLTLRDFEAAQQDFKLLRRLRGKSPALGFLEQAVFTGQRQVLRPQTVFFLGQQVPPEVLVKDIEDAVTACSELLQQPAPVIVVNCSNRQQAIYLTHREFPGFAVITLSTHSPKFPSRLRRTVFHEVAHSFLASGARLLDEGFAIWFAENYSGVLTKKITNAQLPEGGLRALLLSAGKEGALFENTGLDGDEITSVRRIAADLLGELVKKESISGVVHLFESVSDAASGEEIVSLVEKALERPLEQFIASPSATPTAEDENAFYVEACRALMHAWSTRDAGALPEAVTRLESRSPRSATLVDALINLRIAYAAIALQHGIKPDEKDLTTIDTLLSEAATLGLNNGRLFTLRGKRSDLAIQVARPHVIKMVNASQKALHWYTKALRESPNDPDLLVHYGIHEAHVPAQHGGGREKALHYIGQATSDPLWGFWAKQLIANFDHHIMNAIAQPAAPVVAKQPDASAPPPASIRSAPERVVEVALPKRVENAVPVSKPTGKPAAEITGLRVKVSSEFELEIPELLVRSGEKLAIIGHNGAGKSVFLETLLSLRSSTSGSIALLGGDTKRLRHNPDDRRHIGASLQNINFAGLIRVKEIVRTHFVAYGTQSAKVTEALGISELLQKEFKTLSKGQKQRVKVFLALAHRPKLVVLDEPSVGLDERYARSLRQYLSSPEMSETTVLIASHVAADIALTDRVVCLGGGKLIDSGNIRELVERYVGRFRAQVNQTLTPVARADLEKIEGLLRPPIDQAGKVIVYGRENFERRFIAFLERHAISAFSLEPSSTEDFLAHIAHKSK